MRATLNREVGRGQIMGQPAEIRTDRLLLRPLTPGDFSAVHAYASDPDVTRYMEWGPNTEEDTRAFISNAVTLASEPEPRPWDFAVVERGQLVGVTGIRLVGQGGGEIGYCYSKSVWGRGVATEAADALLALAFGRLRLHRVQARCDPENAGSARVLEKIGMQLEGRLRHSALCRGEWKDRLLFSILETEWSCRGARSGGLLESLDPGGSAKHNA